LGIVELDDGLRIVSRLTEARVDRLHAGLPMCLVIEPISVADDGVALLSYAFRPETP
jgi:uncharacterized OB-fold protein